MGKVTGEPTTMPGSDSPSAPTRATDCHFRPPFCSASTCATSSGVMRADRLGSVDRSLTTAAEVSVLDRSITTPTAPAPEADSLIWRTCPRATAATSSGVVAVAESNSAWAASTRWPASARMTSRRPAKTSSRIWAVTRIRRTTIITAPLRVARVAMRVDRLRPTAGAGEGEPLSSEVCRPE